MFSQERGGKGNLGRSSRKLDREPCHGNRSYQGVFHFKTHSAVDDLGIVENLVDRVDGTAGNARLI